VAISLVFLDQDKSIDKKIMETVMHSNAQQQQCTAMHSNAQQCTAMHSNAQQ
jgi:hypothetical protein